MTETYNPEAKLKLIRVRDAANAALNLMDQRQARTPGLTDIRNTAMIAGVDLTGWKGNDRPVTEIISAEDVGSIEEIGLP